MTSTVCLGCHWKARRVLVLLVTMATVTVLLTSRRGAHGRGQLEIKALKCQQFAFHPLRDRWVDTDAMSLRRNRTLCSNLGLRDALTSIYQSNATLKETPPTRYMTPSIVNKTPPIQPYVPAHKAVHTSQPETFGRQWAGMLQEGRGLTQCVTSEGEEVTWENGVQYHRYPYHEPPDSVLWMSELEPHVPFNPEVFFLHDQEKIQSYARSVEDAVTSGLDPPLKVILWWQAKDTNPTPMCMQPLRMCPDLPCVITKDRSLLDVSHALLVNEQYILSSPPPRRPDQVGVFYQIEPPSDQHFYTGADHSIPGWSNFFNWTMSYRLDSDISTYYGMVRKRLKPKEKNYTSIMADKTGLVAWMMSNAGAMSDRDKYVSKLRQYLPVDVIGSSGTFRCPRDQDKVCSARISKQYKFYLSFESAFCEDYVTEKFFKFFNMDLITVARGKPDYSKLAPEGTFINTADFKSPKELAERILYLDSHDEEYVKLLKRKDEYVSLYEDYLLTNGFSEYRYEAVSFCHLCHRLWNVDNYAKTIPNVREWFKEGKCYKPHDLIP